MRMSDWSSDVCSSVLACGTGRGYAPTGPDPSAYGRATGSEPWGPYIRAAADRFDVPEAWVRAVMQMGRASCRERVCQYVSITVVGGSLRKKTQNHSNYSNTI